MPLNINTRRNTASIMPASQLQAKRTQALYKQVNFILLSNVLVAFLLSVALFELTENIYSIYWFCFLAAFTVFRYILLKKYYSYERDDKSTIKWGWIFSFTTLVSGCTWGSASLLFLDTSNIAVMLLLLMTLTGITVGSAAALANFAISYYAFSIPTLLPFIYVLISQGSFELTIFSAMLMVFLILQLVIARKNQNTMDKSIILNHENIDLISQLNIKKKKAEDANSSKTKFLAAASHDLRQPLHSMRLFIDVLDENNIDSNQDEVINKIKKSCLSLENLLESLLDISKLDAGVVTTNTRPFPMQHLFNLLDNEFDSIAKEKNLDLRFIPTPQWVNSDQHIIERILRNLISNAIRYTEHGKVLIGCRKKGNTAILFVCDTGIGINVNNIDLVFEEFHQINNPNRDRNEGLGLGLSIVKRLSELLKTELLLQSKPGSGSVFSIQLPLTFPYESTQETNTPLVMGGELNGQRIIIIEDEADIREALNLLLSGWGCKISELTCIADITPENLPTDKPDIILADYRLANNETGVMVIHALHNHYQDGQIPAIIITGDTAPDRIKEISNSGFNILHKPVQGGKLRATLSSLLSK